MKSAVICIVEWADYDPVVDLPGRELDVVVRNETYEEVLRNRVGRYVIPK